MNTIKSLKFAIKGIIYAVKNERNMRIHTVVAMYVLIFSLFFDMTFLKYAILILAIGLVIMAEMFNSAIENLIDLYSKDYNAAAKVAKDVAAGAVLIMCGTAIAIGAMLFNDFSAYIKMWAFFYAHPILILLLSFCIFISYKYIFLGPIEMKNRFKGLLYRIKRKNEKSELNVEKQD